MFDESQIMYAGTQASDDDKRLFVQFSFEPRVDSNASEAAGHNVYKDVEFVTIRVPGDKTTTVHRPVRPADKHRFPLQYAQFKNRAGEQVVGFPLSAWPGCTPAQAKELEYFNVKTVEQLASMPDSVGGAQMMGVTALRQNAKSFIEARRQEAPLIKVQSELASRDATIAALQATIEKQGQTLDRLLAALPDPEAKDQSKKGK